MVDYKDRFDPSARGIANGIKFGIERLSTPYMDAPYVKDHVAVTDSALQTHVMAIVEVVTADVAVDVQLAGEALQGVTPLEKEMLTDGALEACESAFKNAKRIHKEKVHGARRVLSRTWDRDAGLAPVANTLIMGSDSMCQKIQHAKDIRDRSVNHVKDMESTGPFKATLMNHGTISDAIAHVCHYHYGSSAEQRVLEQC